MLEVITQLGGGIGLFLIGMILMTDSLKEMAGERLRIWLSRFTGSPLKAILSGAGLTLLVQSSTATTLATIGFVSAGILTFTQAIGVVIGANIGTTSVGWMVAILGVKFSIGSFALPLVAFGALCKLLGRGKLALFGMSLAGFGLIFYGIQMLQVSMAGFSELVDLSKFASDSIGAQIVLILIGILMTVILQSSSAAVTTTLAALASGAIDLPQALGLVIGQNIGTVSTAILASVGASVNAKRTAAVHVIFNLVSAVLALLILEPFFIWLAQEGRLMADWAPVFIVAAFHTLFSLVGTLFFFPVIKQFEQLVMKLIPDSSPSILALLDKANLSVPALAIDASSKVIHHNLIDILGILKRAVEEGVVPSNRQLQHIDEVLQGVQFYIEDMPTSEHPEDQKGLTFVLRLMVYSRVLRSDLSKIRFATCIRNHAELYQVGLDYSQIVGQYLEAIQEGDLMEESSRLRTELMHLKKWLDDENSSVREGVMQHAAIKHLSAAERLDLLAALRWLNRTITHTQRLANVLFEDAKQR